MLIGLPRRRAKSRISRSPPGWPMIAFQRAVVRAGGSGGPAES
jgi:hypothetical protein